MRIKHMPDDNSELISLIKEARAKLPIPDSADTIDELSSLISEINHRVSIFREDLEYMPLKAAICNWLIHLDPKIGSNYTDHIKELFSRGIINTSFANGKEFTVGGFRHIRHQAAIDYIKKIDDVDEAIKKEMIECYIAFVNYLDSISYGWFKREVLSAPGEYKMSPGAAGETISYSDWRTLIDMLYETNPRDAIIARVIMVSGKRISDVLALTKEQINYQDNTVSFTRKNNTVNITVSEHLMKELKEYVESTEDQRRSSSIVFITRTGKKVTRARLNYSLAHISKIAGIIRVSPETLRAAWLALKQQGYKDFAILANKKDRRVMKG